MHEYGYQVEILNEYKNHHTEWTCEELRQVFSNTNQEDVFYLLLPAYAVD